MPQIYNGAQNVCVWLGDEEADQGSGLAFNYMRRTLNLEDFDRLIGDSRTPHEWTALESVMTKPWFSRRWVIQEIALAKRATIHCGTHQIPWSDFAEAVALFKEVKPETQINRRATASCSQMKSDFSQRVFVRHSSVGCYLARQFYFGHIPQIGGWTDNGKKLFP